MTVETRKRIVERLDFNSGRPVHTIVIGGNVLARGLTIEGLVCSYFIRTSPIRHAHANGPMVQL